MSRSVRKYKTHHNAPLRATHQLQVFRTAQGLETSSLYASVSCADPQTSGRSDTIIATSSNVPIESLSPLVLYLHSIYQRQPSSIYPGEYFPSPTLDTHRQRLDGALATFIWNNPPCSSKDHSSPFVRVRLWMVVQRTQKSNSCTSLSSVSPVLRSETSAINDTQLISPPPFR